MLESDQALAKFFFEKQGQKASF